MWCPVVSTDWFHRLSECRWRALFFSLHKSLRRISKSRRCPGIKRIVGKFRHRVIQHFWHVSQAYLKTHAPVLFVMTKLAHDQTNFQFHHTEELNTHILLQSFVSCDMPTFSSKKIRDANVFHLHRSTTTESALAGMKPRRKTLRQPQL